MVVASYLFIGLSGTLVTWATAPASLLLVLRFAVAALVLGAVFAQGSLDRAARVRHVAPAPADERVRRRCGAAI